MLCDNIDNILFPSSVVKCLLHGVVGAVKQFSLFVFLLDAFHWLSGN